jgi:hypothetical protein
MLIELQARRSELFEHVVRRAPGSGDDPDRRFAFHFPLFLAELLDDVEGGDSNTVLAEWGEAFDWIAGTTTLVGQAMVSGLDAERVRAAAETARTAGKDETGEWLERIAAGWPQVRALIEGAGTVARVDA